MTADDQKRISGEAAAQLVEAGMVVGLGTGSTAAWFVRALAARDLDIRGVPTSEATANLARELGMTLASLDDVKSIDLTVDGADEIGPRLALIKGGGGALLREKIVAAASARMVVIADTSKVVDPLGAFPLPIEVNPFGFGSTRSKISGVAVDLGLDDRLVLRRHADGSTYVTDGGHWIVDASFRRIPDPEKLSRALFEIPGVVEHGLFLGLATAAVVARADGVDILHP